MLKIVLLVRLIMPNPQLHPSIGATLSLRVDEQWLAPASTVLRRTDT